MRFEHATTTNNSALSIVEFLCDLSVGDRYRRWHPEDHLWCSRTISSNGEPRFTFCEKIGGRVLRLSYTVAHRTDTRVVFAPTGLLKLLRLGSATYDVAESSHGRELTAVLQLGWGRRRRSAVWRLAIDLDALERHLRAEVDFLGVGRLERDEP